MQETLVCPPWQTATPLEPLSGRARVDEFHRCVGRTVSVLEVTRVERVGYGAIGRSCQAAVEEDGAVCRVTDRAMSKSEVVFPYSAHTEGHIGCGRSSGELGMQHALKSVPHRHQRTDGREMRRRIVSPTTSRAVSRARCPPRWASGKLPWLPGQHSHPCPPRWIRF